MEEGTVLQVPSAHLLGNYRLLERHASSHLGFSTSSSLNPKCLRVWPSQLDSALTILTRVRASESPSPKASRLAAAAPKMTPVELAGASTSRYSRV